MGEVVLELRMVPADPLVKVSDGVLRNVFVRNGVSVLVEDELRMTENLPSFSLSLCRA